MAKWGERVVLTTVFIVWVFNFVAQFDFMAPLAGDYEFSESINLTFMGIVGWRYMQRRRNGQDDS